MPNKRKYLLRDRLQKEIKGYDPIIEMAKIANDESVDLNLRAQMHKEVAKYVEPQLKAVEHSGELTQRVLTVAEQIQAADAGDN